MGGERFPRAAWIGDNSPRGKGKLFKKSTVQQRKVKVRW